MTQSSNLRNISAVSALAVTAFVAIAASSGQASAAKTVSFCQGAGRQSVRECCETMVKRNGLPMWMRQTGRNCTSARIVCRGGGNGPTFGIAAAAPRICKYVVIRLREGGGNQPKGNNSPNGRTAGKP